MAAYRRPDIDLDTRLELAGALLLPRPTRAWGTVTDLAREYGVPRKFLYDLRDQASQALRTALAPHAPGPQPPPAAWVIDKPWLQRAITVLALVPGSERGIQLALELLCAQHCALGFISETLQAAGQAAQVENARVMIPLPVLGEADEIFQGHRPCLTVVDGRSFLVLHLAPAEARDATTWGVTFRDLQARGVQFHDLASDAARGIRAGVQEAELAIPLRADHFHLLREGPRLTGRLERRAYQALAVAEKVRRAEREAQAPTRRRGKPLQVTLSRAQAEAQEAQAIAQYDLWVWLWGEGRQALEPYTPTGQLIPVQQARETLETVIELLPALQVPEVTTFAQHLQEHLADLLAPLVWLEQSLAPCRQGLAAATEAAIVWAWQHQQALGITAGEGFPAPQQDVVRACWAVLDLFHRASSLAESLHSWLRPYLQLHRGAPQWLLPLLQLFWNHHTFTRGKRQGHSPLQLAGVADAPALTEALTWLFQPRPTALATV